MGHYLSDFETDKEWRDRTIYSPMAKVLRKYDKEVQRGIVHTDQWNEKMAKDRATLKERGWEV